MTAVQTIAEVSAQSAKTQAQSQQLNQDFDDFLTLLTTQLKHQDPLDPMDSNEFTNQLVQFSQVEQQLQTNDILEDLRALDVLRVTELGLSFVGMDVELAGNVFEFDGEGEVELGYIMPATAKETTISIIDENGDPVYKMDGENTTGIKSFTWDGTNGDGYKVPAGTYTIQVAATDPEGNSLNVQTNVPGRVSGIESDGAGNVLLLVGDLKLPITDITRAKLPDEEDSTTTPAEPAETDEQEGET